ncbi:MAG: hypothetical protein ACK5V3_15240, partial [Bdellovibrionales bacterium]
QVRVALVWTKNPDPRRLGKILKYKKANPQNSAGSVNSSDQNSGNAEVNSNSSSGENAVIEADEELTEEDFRETKFFTSWMSRINLPVEGLSDQKSYLACKNDLWLKDFIKSDGSLTFETISTELMFQNFETGVSENATHMDLYQPQFIKTSVLGWELVDYKNSFGLIKNSDPFLSTQVSHFVLKDKRGDNCHVSFTSDVSVIRQSLNDESFIKIKPETRKPLLKWNLLKESQIEDAIVNILNPKSGNQQEVL